MLTENETSGGVAQNKNYKAICCEKIPELFLDKLVAKKHFSKFGKINRFIFRPKRLICTVEYDTEEEAEKAYNEAGHFNGYEFIVNYADQEVAHIQNTEEWADPEVQAELDSMYPNQRYGSNMRTTTTTMFPFNRTHNFNKIFNKATECTAKSNKTISNDVLTVNSVLRQELEIIMKKPALTDEDKYRVLEARDKLLRLTSVKETDIKKAVAIRGTCPDMCPEKERLMREFQRQVSVYEIVEDEEHRQKIISHRKAIKEYSRSSADQEVPLAHDLRPESVLQMTMLYLMHNIMDLCDEPQTSLKDWFHFIWDRTRSIRKDITQQELCSLTAVELVEQCARFHIHCAARLVSEDPSVFDKKINAENLTKCLQTLKYMYHDLRLKGIYCPREVEFRSYIVLLNLGDANFLWELKQLPPHIQNAVDIKRAITFYNVLQSNNYVRFFSMIKSDETSYLSACILLGYFNKLRLRAMEAITKSHNAHKIVVHLPLTHLTKILAFENISAAISFFSCHGLTCNKDEDRVFLDRLIKPDLEYVMDRALNLVESKRRVSIGECICGHPLPSSELFEHHEPHNSFDANGLLKPGAWTAEDQMLEESFIKKRDNYEDKCFSTSVDSNIFKVPLSSSPSIFKQYQKQQGQDTAVHNAIKRDENYGTFSQIDGFKIGESAHINKGISEAHPIITTCESEGSILFSGHRKLSPLNSLNNHLVNLANEPLCVEKQEMDKQFSGSNIFVTSNSPALFHTRSIFSFNHREAKLGFQENKISQVEKQSIQKQTIEMEKMQQSEWEKVHREQQQSEFKSNKQESTEEHKENQELMKIEEIKRNQIEVEKKRKEKELLMKTIEEAAQEYFEILNKEVQDAEIKIIVQEEYLVMNKIAEHLVEELLEETSQDIIYEVAHDEYAAVCYNHILLSKYFIQWLKLCRRKKEQMQVMEEAPIWVTTTTRAQCAEQMIHPWQNENMHLVKRFRWGQPCNFKQLLRFNNLLDKEKPLINLFDIINQTLQKQFSPRNRCSVIGKRKYFKLLLTLPSDTEELPGFKSRCNKWLIKNIEKAQSEIGPFVHGLQNDVALCVRKLTGLELYNEQGDVSKHEIDHSDGIICFISGINMYEASRKRIENLLMSSQNYKRIPMAIIAYNCPDEKAVGTLLNLSHFLENNVISHYKCFGCKLEKADFSFRQLFVSAVQYVALHSIDNNIAALQMDKIRNIFDICLGEEIWERWLISSYNNPIFKKMCTRPQYVVSIFNLALQHVSSLIEKDLSEMPEFPFELKEFVPLLSNDMNKPLTLEHFPLNWKSSKRNMSIEIQKLLKNIKMPNIKRIESISTDIESMKLFLLNYACKCVPQDELVAIDSAQSAMREMMKQLQCKEWQKYDFETRLGYLNYLPIMKPIIFARLNYHFEIVADDILMAYIPYMQNDMCDYKQLPWWLDYEPLIQVTEDYDKTIQSDLSTSCKCIKDATPEESSNLCSENMNRIIQKAETLCQKLEENTFLEKIMKRVRHESSNDCYRVKRNLDESLYEFELAQNIGCYDTSNINRVTDEIDKTLHEIENPLGNLGSLKKRKYTEHNNDAYNNGKIISTVNTALALITEMEEVDDRRYKAIRKFKFLHRE